MEIVETGLMFIAIGMLIKFYPHSIASFDELPQSENEVTNDIPTFVSIVFNSMGVFIVAGHYVSIWLEQPSLNGKIGISVPLIGLIVLVVFGIKLIKKPGK